MNNLSPWSPFKKKRKTKNFFESLLAHILGMFREILFRFEMWPPLSGGYLHCKIRIRHHGATYA